MVAQLNPNLDVSTNEFDMVLQRKILWQGSMDEAGKAMKSPIYRNVMSGIYVIDAPKEFAEYADRTIKGTTSIGGIKWYREFTKNNGHSAN